MKAKSSGVVGVILADTSEGYCARALKGIEEAASALEYRLWLETAVSLSSMRRIMWSACSGLGLTVL